MTVNREELKDAAVALLREIAAAAATDLGDNLYRTQTSSWMIKTSETSQTSQEFQRKVFDWMKVYILYQKVKDEMPHTTVLSKMLVTAGHRGHPVELTFDFVYPLVKAWSKLEKPLEFKGPEFEQLVLSFRSKVIDHDMMTKSNKKYALFGVDLQGKDVTLDHEVSIRRISDAELWELGDVTARPSFSPTGESAWSSPHLLGQGLSSDWVILDIVVEHDEKENPSDRLRLAEKAAYVDMALSREGGFSTVSLDSIIYGETLGRFGRRGYMIDEATSENLHRFWAGLRAPTTDNHLRLALSRLLEGLKKYEREDAIIDFTIAMETLLVIGREAKKKTLSERGASIICWSGGAGRKQTEEELKLVYKTRSDIVHGESAMESAQVARTYECAEAALKSIVRWYLDNGVSSPTDLRNRINKR